MNYTESFDQFASKLNTTDIALYAGVGIILWVLFKDKLSPVQQFLYNLFPNKKTDSVIDQKKLNIPVDNIISNIFSEPTDIVSNKIESKDNFYNLVVSWKQTRDLAVKSGCLKAVEVADQMFPFLSPSVCEKENENE